MPEAEVKNDDVKEEKTVDIDTSGPDVDIAIPEEKDLKEVEVKEEPKDEQQVTGDKEPEV